MGYRDGRIFISMCILFDMYNGLALWDEICERYKLMTRYVALGNGSMLVDLDSNGLVRDLYYPYVGQENHVNGKKHMIGVWVEGKFSWFDSGEWKRTLVYEKETMVSNLIGIHKSLGIELRFRDAVDYKKNIFMRRITVRNMRKKQRKISIFLHQRFECYESNIGDTVYYHPSLGAVIHYKGKRYFLMNGMYKNEAIHGMNSYTTGLAGERGLEGTYKDAEDGYLSGNPIEHGSVDSTVSFLLDLPPEQSHELDYWICAGKDFYEVSELNSFVHKHGVAKLIDKTAKHWFAWVNRTKFEFMGLNDKVVDLFKRSLLFIRAHIDDNGAVIASSDSDILFMRRDSYAYMWPRDGALIVRSLDRAGYSKLTEQFFNFCERVITPDGYLFHKYRPDGSLGSSWHPWIHEGSTQLPFQEDQVGLVLDSFWKHFEQHAQVDHAKKALDSFIRKSADFMVNYMDKSTGLPFASYDLWEEKLGIFTFTCSAVYAGLQAAGHFESQIGTAQQAEKYYNASDKLKEAILTHLYDEKEKRFIKGVYYKDNELKKDMTNDASSVYGVFHFKVLEVDDERIRSSFEYFKKDLKVKTKIGGYARYEGDVYHKVSDKIPGNPWFITSLWLAEYYIALAKTKKELEPAIDMFNWVTKHALPTGALSEQLHPLTGEPLSVTPLTWSHAAFVIAINKYLEKLDELEICKMCNPPKLYS